MKDNDKFTEGYYTERRADERFPLNDSSAVIVNPGAVVSFQVLDICASGLAFSYNPTGQQRSSIFS